MLTWSREQAGLTLEEAARLLNLKDSKKKTAAEKLEAFETGAALSRNMLNKFSKVYKRPLLTFYLTEPPRKSSKGHDFRSVPEALDPRDNYHVDVLVRDIRARQSILREALIVEDEAEQLPFIGSVTLDEGVKKVGKALCKLLDFDLNEFRSQKSYEHAFKLLRGKAEDKGINIILKGNLGSYHSDIPLKVFRAFTLSDDIAPFIVINHLEVKTARAFTLLHELTHLLLGETGVSNSIAASKVEKFCDSVASEVLLPSAEFDRFNPDLMADDILKDEISLYASDRRVSSTLVAYRLLQRGVITPARYRMLSNFYLKQAEENKQREKEANKEKDGGPNQMVIRRSYLGGLLSLAERLSFSGAISATKAGILLGVKPLQVYSMFNKAGAA